MSTAVQGRRYDRKKFWQTKEGELVKIEEMTDGHLLNAVWMMLRIGAKKRSEALRLGYSLVAGMQGEMAVDDMERGILRYEEMDAEDMAEECCGGSWEALNAEVDRRGLRGTLEEGL